MRRHVLDDHTMFVVRTPCVVAMGEVRGRDEDISRTPSVSPDYEPLHDRRYRPPKTSLLEGLIRTRKAVAIAQVKEGFMVLGS
jgi:hypothetical protein